MGEITAVGKKSEGLIMPTSKVSIFLSA